jgi:hypothetical protein
VRREEAARKKEEKWKCKFLGGVIVWRGGRREGGRKPITHYSSLALCIFYPHHTHIHTHTYFLKQPPVQLEAAERAKLGAAALEGGGEEGPGGFEKLDPREIKKMNGPKLKECLKERGLSTQGQKKELMDRLVAFAMGK